MNYDVYWGHLIAASRGHIIAWPLDGAREKNSTVVRIQAERRERREKRRKREVHKYILAQYFNAVQKGTGSTDISP